jgi:D-galactarolactone cycloisomerase
MKITRVEPIVVSVPYSYGLPDHSKAQWPAIETLLVKVETDDGVTGWGEGFGFAGCATTRTAIETLIAPLAIGRDTRDIAGLGVDLQRRLHSQGRNGPVIYGLSGLDIALWDIAGKVAGQPIHRLLAADGPASIPSYASLLRYGDPALAARNAVEAVQGGYAKVKLHEIAAAEVSAVRDAVGPRIELMLDTNCRWPPEEALAHAQSMEPFELTWIEEPVWPPEDYARLREVSGGTHTAIAAGENHATLCEFERLIDVGGVRYVQPSVTKIGGVSEALKIIALAKARGVKVAPHSPYFGPGLVATVHLCAALARDAACEQFYCELAARPFDAGMSARNGRLRVPDGPGLGIEPDASVIARYRVG